MSDFFHSPDLVGFLELQMLIWIEGKFPWDGEGHDVL